MGFPKAGSNFASSSRASIGGTMISTTNTNVYSNDTANISLHTIGCGRINGPEGKIMEPITKYTQRTADNASRNMVSSVVGWIT